MTIKNTDNWVPACGGTEMPFKTRTGVKVQYLWNPATGEHRYIDCGTDILIPNDDLAHVFGY
tara:strand:+ start:194 stop:379 length:186 start_codon:yes stop_codon:yes gene_type:complete